MTPRERAEDVYSIMNDPRYDAGERIAEIERHIIEHATPGTDNHTRSCGMCGKSIESSVYVRLNDKYVHRECHMAGLKAERDEARAEVAKLRDYKFGPKEIVQALERQKRDADRRIAELQTALEKSYYWAQQERVAIDRIDEYESDMTAARAALSAPARPAPPDLGTQSIVSQLREIIADQANDEGLWFDADRAPEAYLQQSLRDLHSVVERAIEGLIHHTEKKP